MTKYISIIRHHCDRATREVDTKLASRPYTVATNKKPNIRSSVQSCCKYRVGERIGSPSEHLPPQVAAAAAAILHR